jgi:hypothetical protein
MTKGAALALHGSSAFSFVLTLGIVNLFADMTYEGGVSINEAFLGSLGASAAAISIIAGAGEFLGYSLRCRPIAMRGRSAIRTCSGSIGIRRSICYRVRDRMCDRARLSRGLNCACSWKN